MSEPKIITTDSGDLRLELEPTEQDIMNLRGAWPYGIARLQDDDGSISYGLVFQNGEQEVWGLKVQQKEAPSDVAEAHVYENRVRASAAAARIVGKRSDASILVATYFREREPELIETGIALFPAFLGEDPPPAGPPRGPGGVLRSRLPGAEAIVDDFFEALVSQDSDICDIAPFIGFDPRPRLMMGTLILEFLVCGDWIANLYPEVEEDDPRWIAVARAGVHQMVHLPSVCFAVDQ